MRSRRRSHPGHSQCRRQWRKALQRSLHSVGVNVCECMHVRTRCVHVYVCVVCIHVCVRQGRTVVIINDATLYCHDRGTTSLTRQTLSAGCLGSQGWRGSSTLD